MADQDEEIDLNDEEDAALDRVWDARVAAKQKEKEEAEEK